MKKTIKHLLLFGFVTTVILTSCSKEKDKIGKAESIGNDLILVWNQTAFEAFGGPNYQHSLMASRINAMMHIAMHDALNAVQPKYETYLLTEKDTAADPQVAAAVAAYEVLLHEIPSRQGFLDTALQQSIAGIADGPGKARGVALGKKAALAILVDRLNDKSSGEVIGQVSPSDAPGIFRPVPPYNILFAPHWADVKLFSLHSKDQFRCTPAPALNSESYTADFNEVKMIGQAGSHSRTPEQAAYAKFWYEFSEAGWNRVARTVTTDKKLGLLETARIFALVNIALADAYIAGWDSKFFYNSWRPYTAIRLAETDGNDATNADGAWESAEPTPPVQDYPSTHSALGNAGATVLARLLSDETSFSMSSFTAVPVGATRSFKSFSQAANENADSRVIAGIHFRFSCVAGQKLGDQIGNWVVDNKLKKLK